MKKNKYAMLYYIMASLLFCCCQQSTANRNGQVNNKVQDQLTCSESIPEMKYEEAILAIDTLVRNFERLITRVNDTAGQLITGVLGTGTL